MTERLDGDVIITMTNKILKSINTMEKDLDDIVLKLDVFTKNIQDKITQEAKQLVLNIREQIDYIKQEATKKNKNAQEGARLQNENEDEGM